jgi:hypothetical protein
MTRTAELVLITSTLSSELFGWLSRPIAKISFLGRIMGLEKRTPTTEMDTLLFLLVYTLSVGWIQPSIFAEGAIICVVFFASIRYVCFLMNYAPKLIIFTKNFYVYSLRAHVYDLRESSLVASIGAMRLVLSIIGPIVYLIIVMFRTNPNTSIRLYLGFLGGHVAISLVAYLAYAFFEDLSDKVQKVDKSRDKYLEKLTKLRQDRCWW